MNDEGPMKRILATLRRSLPFCSSWGPSSDAAFDQGVASADKKWIARLAMEGWSLKVADRRALCLAALARRHGATEEEILAAHDEADAEVAEERGMREGDARRRAADALPFARANVP